MEDASICKCNLGDGNALFGVFDGHLGKFYSISFRSLSQSICQKNICLDSHKQSSLQKEKL